MYIIWKETSRLCYRRLSGKIFQILAIDIDSYDPYKWNSLFRLQNSAFLKATRTQSILFVADLYSQQWQPCSLLKVNILLNESLGKFQCIFFLFIIPGMWTFYALLWNFLQFFFLKNYSHSLFFFKIFSSDFFMLFIL